MKTKLLLIGLQLICFMIFCQNTSIVKDVDGNTYKTVQINGLEWMAENLSVKHFNDKTALKETTSIEEWGSLSKNGIPLFTEMSYQKEGGSGCGLVYNWYAVSDGKGLCPKGWRVPTFDEWIGFSEYEAVKIKSKKGWQLYYDFFSDTEFDTNGSDDFGFNALPCTFNMFDPLMYGEDERMPDIFTPFFGIGTSWACSSEDEKDSNKVWYASLYYANSNILFNTIEKQEMACFVRCVKE